MTKPDLSAFRDAMGNLKPDGGTWRMHDELPFDLHFDPQKGQNVLRPTGDVGLFEKPESHIGKVLDVPHDDLASTISDLSDRRKLSGVVVALGGKPARAAH